MQPDAIASYITAYRCSICNELKEEKPYALMKVHVNISAPSTVEFYIKPLCNTCYFDLKETGSLYTEIQ